MRRTIIHVAGLLSACSGQALDVGSDRADVSDTPPAFVAGRRLVVPAEGACSLAADPAFAGTWQGQTEDFYFNTVAKWRVEITGQTSDGAPCGRVVLGEGEPPAPAVDPESRYPDASSGYPKNFGQGGAPAGWGPMPGAVYTILESGVREQTLRLRISPSELWRGWCALQTPDASGLCLPNGVITAGPGANERTITTPRGSFVHPADQVALCLQALVCSCDETDCGATDNSEVTFDLAFDGAVATGSVSTHGAIRLERTSP